MTGPGCRRGDRVKGLSLQPAQAQGGSTPCGGASWTPSHLHSMASGSGTGTPDVGQTGHLPQWATWSPKRGETGVGGPSGRMPGVVLAVALAEVPAGRGLWMDTCCGRLTCVTTPRAVGSALRATGRAGPDLPSCSVH